LFLVGGPENSPIKFTAKNIFRGIDEESHEKKLS